MFSKEHYDQIIKLLSQVNTNSSTAASANAASIVSQVTNKHTTMIVSGGHEWTIDTGATNHMTSDLDLLNKESVIKNVIPKRIDLPNADVSLVTHTVTSVITPKSSISNVFYVPQFNYNLLSVSKLTKELQCCVSFFPDFCIF